MPDKYATDLAVTGVALNTVTMPSASSSISISPTPAVSRAQQPQRRRSEGCWASGYSRRGNRSPHLCFKTVLASFPAHGSSVVGLLSRGPQRACDLYVHAFA